jgi:hypothetical protein
MLTAVTSLQLADRVIKPTSSAPSNQGSRSHLEKEEANHMKKLVALFRISILVWSVVIPGLVFGQVEAKDSGIPTKENPIHVDSQERSVVILAEVNGKYLDQTTRHAIVYSGGRNGNKSVFRSYATPKDFCDALIKIGLKAGDNMTMDNKEKTLVQGDLLEVTVSWSGSEKKEYRLDDVIADSNGKPIEVRFGGNLKNALRYNTGCLLCLDSCPVGITSNAAYTYGAVEKRNEVTFRGKKDVLPPDGTMVLIKLKAKTK